MSGFIAMSREAFDHPLLQDGDRFRAWFWLVANAAWKPTRTRIKGQMVEIERGELSFSQRFLAEKWGWSKSRVDRFIADLREEGMIETRSKNGATAGHNAGQGQAIITICNYAKYQDVSEVGRGKAKPENGATAGQQRGKEEQGNKGTIEEEPKGSPSPKTRARRKSRSKNTNERAQQLNPRSTDRNPRQNKNPSGEVPDWIPDEQWNAFIEMRVRKRAAPTARAISLIIGKLEKLSSAGHDPGSVLDQSTINNWTDIYPLKDNQNDRSQNNRGSSSGGYGQRDSRDGFQRAIDRRMGVDGYHDTGQPSGEAGRQDAGESSGDSDMPSAQIIPLR